MTDPATPVVTAVIPAHNAEAFVAEAIESVLGQTYPAIECIVVDDGSSDGTAEALGRYEDRIRLLRQPNRGVSAARNRGASLGRGDLLAFLDADDVWRPDRLERMIERLDSDPRADAVLCATQVVDRSLRPLDVIRLDFPLGLSEILLCEASLVSPSSNLLITRTCFDAIGGFDTRLSTAADWALLLRIVDGHGLAYLDHPLALHRRHGANMSRNIAAMEHDMVLVYDEVFSGNGARSSLRAVRRRAYANLRRMIAGSYYVRGDMGGFVRNAVLSVASHPAVLSHFLAYPLRRLQARRKRRASDASHG